MESNSFSSSIEVDSRMSPANDGARVYVRWTQDSEAKEDLLKLLSGFYALFLTIVALVLELSHMMTSNHDHTYTDSLKDTILAGYLYIGSLVFFVYCYAILLNTQWSRPIRTHLPMAIDSLRRNATNVIMVKSKSNEKHFSTIVVADKPPVFQQTIADDDQVGSKSPVDLNRIETTSARLINNMATHSSPTTGSLYLRLGCIAFGLFGVVYYGLGILMCLFSPTNDISSTGYRNECNANTICIKILTAIFVFVQMHFIFCNSQLTVHSSRSWTRIGLMHLMATNLATWIRFLLIEESETSRAIQRSSNEIFQEHEEEPCEGAECVFGTFSQFMYTCVMEHALIGAGVMFVIWKNVGKIIKHSSPKFNRPGQIRIDCSRTTTGLFAGLAFLALILVSIGLFQAYVSDNNNSLESTVFFSTAILLRVIMSIACVCALWRLRLLNYDNYRAHKTAHLLDRLLLSAGLIGELIFCIASLVALLGNADLHAHQMSLQLFLTFFQMSRLIQVILQTCLLLLAEQLKTRDPVLQFEKPAKQLITFLLIANLSLFIMNSFEAQKAGISADIVKFYGERNWALLIRGCAPLDNILSISFVSLFCRNMETYLFN